MAQFKIGETVVAIGTLPRDAEFKIVGAKETPLCKFGLKVGEKPTDDGRREAIWANCICWRDVAKSSSSFCKGDAVLAVGKLKTNEFTGRDGEPRKSTELECEFVIKMPVGAGMPSAPPAYSEPAQFAELDESDGELPF